MKSHTTHQNIRPIRLTSPNSWRYFSLPSLLVLLLVVVAAVGISISTSISIANAQETSTNQTPRRWAKPTPDPDRITLTWASDPATSQAVTWRTDDSIPSGVAEVTLADGSPNFPKNSHQVQAKTESLCLNRAYYNPDWTVHYHTAKFEDLQPDTLYAYRVGDGNDRWSEWFQFKTAKRGPAPFSFIYVGDAQNGILSHWARLIRSAYTKQPDASFIIHAGDLINTAHNDLEWGEWFEALGWIHGMIPAIAVPGNHEYRQFTEDRSGPSHLSMQWRPQFEYPVTDSTPEALKETCYVIDYQGTRIIALNTLDGVEEQKKFLETALTNHNAQWVIVTFHHPIFASAVNRDNLELREAWKPLLDQYNVDLVLQGHDHTYARGHTSKSNGKISESNSEVGTVYVNSVSGSKMYNIKSDRWNSFAEAGAKVVRMAENSQLFQTLKVTQRTVEYSAYLPTGELYDAFTLEKDSEGVKTLRDSAITSTPERTFENTTPRE